MICHTTFDKTGLGFLCGVCKYTYIYLSETLHGCAVGSGRPLAAGFAGLLTAAVLTAAVWAAIVLEAIVTVSVVATAATAAWAWLAAVVAVGAVASARAVAGELLGVQRPVGEGHQTQLRVR